MATFGTPKTLSTSFRKATSGQLGRITLAPAAMAVCACSIVICFPVAFPCQHHYFGCRIVPIDSAQNLQPFLGNLRDDELGRQFLDQSEGLDQARGADRFPSRGV